MSADVTAVSSFDGHIGLPIGVGYAGCGRARVKWAGLRFAGTAGEQEQRDEGPKAACQPFKTHCGRG